MHGVFAFLVLSQVTLYAMGWPLLRGDFPPVDLLEGLSLNHAGVYQDAPVAQLGDFLPIDDLKRPADTGSVHHERTWPHPHY